MLAENSSGVGTDANYVSYAKNEKPGVVDYFKHGLFRSEQQVAALKIKDGFFESLKNQSLADS